MSVFLVESSELDARTVLGCAASIGLQARRFPDSQTALMEASLSPPSAVILSLHLPDDDFRKVLKKIKEIAPRAQTVAVVPAQNKLTVAELLRWGVDNYLERPVDPLRVATIMRSILRETSADKTISLPLHVPFESELLEAGADALRQCRRNKGPLVIEGEPGSGKRTFGAVLLNRGGIAHEVLSCESDDLCQRISNLRRNESVILPRVDRITHRAQHALLSYLDRADCARLILTCTGYVFEAVRDGRLIPELGSRLQAHTFRLPQFKQRDDLIARLTDQFSRQACGITCGNNAITQSDFTLNLTVDEWNFPDGIYSLRRQVFAAHFGSLQRHEPLKEPKKQTISHVPKIIEKNGSILKLAEIERTVIETVLGHFHGNVTSAAQALGIGRNTLYRKISVQEPGPDRSRATPTAYCGDGRELADEAAKEPPKTVHPINNAA